MGKPYSYAAEGSKETWTWSYASVSPLGTVKTKVAKATFEDGRLIDVPERPWLTREHPAADSTSAAGYREQRPEDQGAEQREGSENEPPAP